MTVSFLKFIKIKRTQGYVNLFHDDNFCGIIISVICADSITAVVSVLIVEINAIFDLINPRRFVMKCILTL